MGPTSVLYVVFRKCPADLRTGRTKPAEWNIKTTTTTSNNNKRRRIVEGNNKEIWPSNWAWRLINWPAKSRAEPPEWTTRPIRTSFVSPPGGSASQRPISIWLTLRTPQPICRTTLTSKQVHPPPQKKPSSSPRVHTLICRSSSFSCGGRLQSWFSLLAVSQFSLPCA